MNEARCGCCENMVPASELVESPSGGAMICRKCAGAASTPPGALPSFWRSVVGAWRRWRAASAERALVPSPSAPSASKSGIVRGHQFTVRLTLVSGRWDQGQHRLDVHSDTAPEELADAVTAVLVKRLKRRGADWIDDLEFRDYWKHLELEAAKLLKRRNTP